MNVYDIINNRYGKTTIVEYIGYLTFAEAYNNPNFNNKHKYHLYRYKCDCGNFGIYERYNILKGRLHSCGCLPKLYIDPYDIINKQINKLRPIEYLGFKKAAEINTKSSKLDPDRQHWYKCKCECGNEVVLARHRFFNKCSNIIKSCGCGGNSKNHIKNRELLFGGKYYKIYKRIHNRCYNPNSADYKNYGLQGIKLDKSFEYTSNIITLEDFYIALEQYKNFETYLDYLLEKQNYKYEDIKLLRLTIDRLDNRKGYIKGNMRWATPSEQNKNQDRYYFKYDNYYVNTNVFAEFSFNKSDKALNQKNTYDKNLSVEEYFKYHNQSFKRKEFEDYIQNYKNNDPFSPDLVKKYRPNIILDAITILVGSIIKSKISNTKYYKPNKIIDYNIINNPEYIITSNDGTKYIKY